MQKDAARSAAELQGVYPKGALPTGVMDLLLEGRDLGERNIPCLVLGDPSAALGLLFFGAGFSQQKTCPGCDWGKSWNFRMVWVERTSKIISFQPLPPPWGLFQASSNLALNTGMRSPQILWAHIWNITLPMMG